MAVVEKNLGVEQFRHESRQWGRLKMQFSPIQCAEIQLFVLVQSAVYQNLLLIAFLSASRTSS